MSTLIIIVKADLTNVREKFVFANVLPPCIEIVTIIDITEKTINYLQDSIYFSYQQVCRFHLVDYLLSVFHAYAI